MTTAFIDAAVRKPRTSAIALAAPNLLTICLVATFVLNYITPFNDLDFAWQIRGGERILETGQLLPTEAFSYTIHGKPVSQFEWLYEVSLYGVWSAFGFGGLKLLRTAFTVVPLLLVGLRLSKGGVRWHGIALTLIAAVGLLYPFWNLRPLCCTTIGLLLVSGWLRDHCTGRRPLTWWLPLAMLLWGNLHPGVITGQGLVFGAIAWEWLNRLLRWNPPLSTAACRRLTLIGGLGLAATFLSPAPIARFLLVFQPELRHPIFRLFGEMQPLPLLIAEHPVFTISAYLLAAVGTLGVLCQLRRVRGWEAALLLGLAFLANSALRCVPDWELVTLAIGIPLFATTLRNAFRARRVSEGYLRPLLALRPVTLKLRRAFQRPQFRVQPGWLIGACIVLIVASLTPPLGRRMPKQNSPEWPVAALDWIEANGVHGRFFAQPDHGTYIGWRLRERGLCYVDARGFLFPPELIEDSHFLQQLTAEWPERLDRVLAFGTDYFLLETSGPRGKLWETIQPSIAEPLYLDAQVVLLSAAQVRDALATKPALK
jgi:hypothetical protein